MFSMVTNLYDCVYFNKRVVYLQIVGENLGLGVIFWKVPGPSFHYSIWRPLVENPGIIFFGNGEKRIAYFFLSFSNYQKILFFKQMSP